MCLKTRNSGYIFIFFDIIEYFNKNNNFFVIKSI